MQSLQLQPFFELPQVNRNPDLNLNVEENRYKTESFWFSLIAKYGPDVFTFVDTGKKGKYGSYYAFVAKFTYEGKDYVIPVNIKSKEFVMSRIGSKNRNHDNDAHEVSMLFYKSKQNKLKSRLFELMQYLSCVQYKLFRELFPNAMNPLVFSYTPISTKASNTEVKTHKEAFIKFNMSLDKPLVKATTGTYDMNTQFVRYDVNKKNKIIPSHSKITLENLKEQITELSVAIEANIDMSNVHIPLSKIGYVSFKAIVRQLSFFRNEHPPIDHIVIDENTDIFAELMALSKTEDDSDLENGSHVNPAAEVEAFESLMPGAYF